MIRGEEKQNGSHTDCSELLVKLHTRFVLHIQIEDYQIGHFCGPAINCLFNRSFQNDDQSLLSKDISPHRSSVPLVTDHKDLGNRRSIGRVIG